MKKITAFVGTARKKHTHYAVRQFLSVLESFGEVESEIVALTDYKLELCKGCKACFNKGESFCPLQDDRDLLIAKMMASDGVIFASPNYSFNVSAITKMFLDRLSQSPYPAPSLFQLMIFRMSRTSVRLLSDKTYRDYTYYRDQGWFESDYFYPAPLNVFKKAVGNFFDHTTSRSATR